MSEYFDQISIKPPCVYSLTSSDTTERWEAPTVDELEKLMDMTRRHHADILGETIEGSQHEPDNDAGKA